MVVVVPGCEFYQSRENDELYIPAHSLNDGTRRDAPVPIPNTDIKHSVIHGTARESRSSPGISCIHSPPLAVDSKSRGTHMVRSFCICAGGIIKSSPLPRLDPGDSGGNTHDLQWSKSVKRAARDASKPPMNGSAVPSMPQMLEGKDDPRQIWRINDYFSEERRETDRK